MSNSTFSKIFGLKKPRSDRSLGSYVETCTAYCIKSVDMKNHTDMSFNAIRHQGNER